MSLSWRWERWRWMRTQLARRAAQTFELQARIAHLNNRIRLEQYPLMGLDRHAVDPRAVGAPFIGDVELSLLQLDGEMWVRDKPIVQREVTELRVASHLGYLSRETKLFPHVGTLDDDQFAWRALWRGPQALGDAFKHAGGARDYLAGQFAPCPNEQDEQNH